MFSGIPKVSEADKAAVAAIFEKYRDPADPNMMGMDGVGQFCEDIELDPTDPAALVMAYYLRASHAAEFTKDEFVNGFAALGYAAPRFSRSLSDRFHSLLSIAAIKGAVPKWKRDLEKPDVFKEVYNFTFLYSKEAAQRSLCARPSTRSQHLR